MITDKEQFEELCAAYALGALDIEEEALLNEALSTGDDEYQKIFRESIGISYLIHSGIQRAVPSPDVKYSLLQKIRHKNLSALTLFLKHAAHSLGFGNPKFGFTVSLLLLVVIGEISLFSYFTYQDAKFLEKKAALYENQIAAQQTHLQTLTTDLEQTKEILAVLQSPKIEMVYLNGQEINPSGYGKIIWDPVHKIAILHVSRLPKAPMDKDYQLWFLDKDQRAVSAGIFNVRTDNENFFKVSEIPVPDKKEISAFAVTIESKGGVLQPTGTKFLVGIPPSMN